MKDPRLEPYCDEVETFFFRWKGRTGFLSPDDFARVKRWFSEGLPLEAVLEGIELAFRSQRDSREGVMEEVNSLGFCESFVEKAIERRRRMS